MAVTPGKVYKEVPWEKNKQERQEFRLREKMIKKKHKNLYKSMMAGRKERAKEVWLLRKKRRLHEEREKEERKEKKKAEKTSQKEQPKGKPQKQVKQQAKSKPQQQMKGKKVK